MTYPPPSVPNPEPRRPQPGTGVDPNRVSGLPPQRPEPMQVHGLPSQRPEPMQVYGLPPQRPEPMQVPGRPTHPMARRPIPPMTAERGRRRPFPISLSIGMTIVAATEFIFAVLIAWLFMFAGLQALDNQQLGDAAMYRIMSTATHRLSQGLIVPLLLLPIAAIVLAILLLYRKPVMRLMYTVLGVFTVGFAIWWLRGDWWWWAFVVAHIGLCLALVWVPSSSTWYADGQPDEDGTDIPPPATFGGQDDQADDPPRGPAPADGRLSRP